MRTISRRTMMQASSLALAGAFAASRTASAAPASISGVPSWGLGPFLRDDGADHMGAHPQSTFPCPVTGRVIPWEDKDVLCAAAVVKDGKVFLFYRAEDKSRGTSWGTSRIGLAVSADGRHFERHSTPVLYPGKDFMQEYEWPGGCQDPRICETGDGRYLMTYTAWDGEMARLCCATSTDLHRWTKHGLAIGTCHKGKYRDFWSKSGAVICRRQGGRFIAERIKGKFWMYFNETGAMVATSDNLTDWDVVEDAAGKPVIALPLRPGKVDSAIVEPGPPAFLTDKGIFLIYNAGANGRPDLRLAGNVWAVAQALFDPSDPLRLIDRTGTDFFHPERDFEIKHAGTAEGGNSNVTFVESLVWFKGEWRFYYGCADSIVASAVYRP